MLTLLLLGVVFYAYLIGHEYNKEKRRKANEIRVNTKIEIKAKKDDIDTLPYLKEQLDGLYYHLEILSALESRNDIDLETADEKTLKKAVHIDNQILQTRKKISDIEQKIERLKV